MIECTVCRGTDVDIYYEGRMRSGGKEYLENSKVYKCRKCNHIFHNEFKEDNSYYETEEYRKHVDGSASISNFFSVNDELTLMKLEWTGTARFRDKVVMDVGCAGGIFLDYVRGIAKETIAVEPSAIFRNYLQKRHDVFPYVEDVLKERREDVDIACSFDVIEHVEDVNGFSYGIYNSLKSGGEVIIGTPTIGRGYEEILGSIWNEFNFRTQHPNIFTQESLKYLFEKNGFEEIQIKCVQRYDLGNLISWCLYKQPKGNVKFSFISETMNAVFKTEMANQCAGDYLVLYAKKK